MMKRSFIILATFLGLLCWCTGQTHSPSEISYPSTHSGWTTTTTVIVSQVSESSYPSTHSGWTTTTTVIASEASSTTCESTTSSTVDGEPSTESSVVTASTTQTISSASSGPSSHSTDTSTKTFNTISNTSMVASSVQADTSSSSSSNRGEAQSETHTTTATSNVASTTPSSSNMAPAPLVTQSTATSEVTNYIITEGSTQTQLSTITPVISVTLSTIETSSGSSARSETSDTSALTNSSISMLSSLQSTSLLSSSSSVPSAESTVSFGSTISSDYQSLSGSDTSATSVTSSATASSAAITSLTDMFTDNDATYTIVVSIHTESSTSSTETRLVPLSPSQTTATAAVGATFSLSQVSSTTSFVVSSAGFDNPLSHTDTKSCTYVPKGSTTTVTYEPRCLTSDNETACLCPFCAAIDQAVCLTAPAAGNCPESWLCDIEVPPGTTTASWILPPGVDVPSSITDWEHYTTCVTHSDKSKCSSVTYTARVSTSTTTRSDGWVVVIGWRYWHCPDALCNPANFLVRTIRCIFNLNCITGWFEGFPPAPVLVIPPIGPPARDPEIAPHTLSHTGGTPTAQAPTTTPQGQQNSCMESSTFTYTTRYCSTISASNETTVTGCSDVIATTVACTGEGSITTSTVPCSSGIQTEVIIECPANYTATTQCFTNTTSTYTGCSATTSTIFDACTLMSVDYNDSGIASTLSAWLSMFTFTFPTASSSASTTSILPPSSSSMSSTTPSTSPSSATPPVVTSAPPSTTSSLVTIVPTITSQPSMSSFSLPPAESSASMSAHQAAFRLPAAMDTHKQNQTYCEGNNYRYFNITSPAFYLALSKVCDYLATEEIFRPVHGFYYTWSARDNHGVYPASERNLTFAVQWSEELWCENCGCDFVEDQYCPPEKYGNVSQASWKSGEFCQNAFIKSITILDCIEKDGSHKLWSHGGWYATNGLIFSVLAYYESPLYYWDKMGNGTEDLKWEFDQILEGDPAS